MSRYPGRILSSTAPTVNANTAKGIWTLDEALRYSRAGQWPVPTGNGDPFFQYNTMLLPGQGTNGTNNNTFLDSSTNNFTITRNGNTTQGTFTPFSGTAGNWSNFFDGTGDYLTLPDSTALNLETGDFTIELWFYVTTSGVNNPLIYRFDGDASSRNELQFGIVYNSSGNLVFSAFQSTTNDDIPFTGVSINQWHHCALVRSGNNIYAYLDGVRNPTTRTLVGSLNNGGWQTWIGGYREGGTFQYLNGFISNVRILKGTALYTGSTYTVPTAPLTAITNTSLLTCQNNRFVDNSTNAFTLTANGNVAVTPFQPFGAPTVAYSASTIGGSGYFDGSGDYLTVGNDALLAPGTGDFTWEGWFYWIGGSGENVVWTLDTTGGMNIGLAISSGQWGIGSRGVAVQNTFGTLTKNQWMYLAITRSGTTINAYSNGTRIFTGSNSYNYVSGGTLCFGSIATFGGQDFNGYMSGVRWTKGTALYTGSTMTIPTTPNTTTSGGASATTTELLLDFTNAGIIDNAQDNNLETVGNAQISTTQYKWGASSVAFDGTTDYLIPNGSTTNLFAFGSGAFTIEMWFYVTSFPNQYVALYDSRPASTNGFYPVISLENNGAVYFYVNSANAISSGSGVISTGRWYHLAVVKSGSSTKMFVNGNQVGSTYADTNTYLIAANRPVIGAGGFTLGNDSLNGYIQDLRITKGYARYPYNFTAPTAALPLFWQAAATPSSDPYFENTTLLLPGNGTNGAQNNTFLDSSTNAFTITRNGNTTQGTFTPFSQTGWGNFFDGTGDYLSVANNVAFQFGTGDLTAEAWVYPTATPATDYTNIVGMQEYGASASWVLGIDTNLNLRGTLQTTSPSSATNITGGQIPLHQWSHVAMSRSGTTFSIYINGVRVATTTTSQNVDSSGNNLTIGADNNGDEAVFTGYISNVRVVKGTAVYTGTSFTVPTSALTAVANTSLLTCQSNRFVDNSTNAFTITPSGDTSVQAFSPFNPTAAYSTSTVGGSGYFDGTGDYLTSGSTTAFDSFCTGSATGITLTLEAFVYPTATVAGASPWQSAPIFAKGSTYFCFGIYNNKLRFYWFDGATQYVDSTATVPLNAWSQVSATVNGSSITLYVNGTSSGTGTFTGIQTAAQGTAENFGYQPSSATIFTGYISGVRISNNVRTISLQTAPFSNDANTKYLLNFTNAGIIDNTAKNNLETVGGASISTTVSKFGGSSMYFDGTGDYLYRVPSPLFAMNTGDFTIEGWIYLNSTGTEYICHTGTGANDLFVTMSSGVLRLTNQSTTFATSSGTLSTGQWYHFAVVRYSGSSRVYINGVGGTAVACTVNFTQNGLGIGANFVAGANYLNGYINDLRITNGIARYTQNFTPPTTAFLTL